MASSIRWSKRCHGLALWRVLLKTMPRGVEMRILKPRRILETETQHPVESDMRCPDERKLRDLTEWRTRLLKINTLHIVNVDFELDFCKAQQS